MAKAGVSGKLRMRTSGSGSGRAKALAMLDRMAAGQKSERALMAALEAKLHADPVRFFRTVVMPLLPRETTLSGACDDVMEWRSQMDEGPDASKTGKVPR